MADNEIILNRNIQFKELIREVNSVNFEEVRVSEKDYFEGVTYNADLGKLTSILEKFFGAPVYPSQNDLSALAQETVDKFGGIRADQTLYFYNQNRQTLFAMFWPWSDGVHTTVKIAFIQ